MDEKTKTPYIETLLSEKKTGIKTIETKKRNHFNTLLGGERTTKLFTKKERRNEIAAAGNRNKKKTAL